MERLGRRQQGLIVLRLFQAWAAWRSVMKLQIGLWLDLSWSLAYCFDLPGTKFGFMPCGLWDSLIGSISLVPIRLSARIQSCM